MCISWNLGWGMGREKLGLGETVVKDLWPLEWVGQILEMYELWHQPWNYINFRPISDALLQVAKKHAAPGKRPAAVRAKRQHKQHLRASGRSLRSSSFRKWAAN